MNITKLFLAAGLAGLLASGCAARTRLGQIIPAHRLSAQDNDEQVRIQIVKIGKKVSAQTNETAKAMFIPPELAGAAAGLAIDFVKSELEREAERYEAQFGKKVWMTTDDLHTQGTYIVLTRWVRPKADVLGDGAPSDQTKTVWNEAVAAIRAAALSDPKLEDPDAIWNDARGELELRGSDRPGYGAAALGAKEKESERELAFLFVLGLNPYDEHNPFTIRPVYLWSRKTKAKVVAFDYGSAWKPWKWVGFLFFQGGSKVNYKVDLDIESLMSVKAKESQTAVPTMVNTGPADAIIPQLTHELGRLKPYTFEDNVGGWFDIPAYTADHRGYFTVAIRVTESDASNVRKKLQKGAEYLDKNRDSLIERITGAK